MLHSLDARRDRLLTNSPYTQTSGAELSNKVGSLHEGSSVRLTQPSIGEVPTASLESCRFVSRWSSLQVPSRDIRTSGHASRRVHKTTFPQPTATRHVITFLDDENTTGDFSFALLIAVADLILVRPMRAQLTVTLALMMSFSTLRAQDVKTLVQAYEAQADQIAAKLLFAEFAKHADRVHHLAFTFSVQIDAQGRPHNVKIASKTRDAFIDGTARRTLTAAKFSPIPKKVTQALGETLLAIQGDIDADVSP